MLRSAAIQVVIDKTASALYSARVDLLRDVIALRRLLVFVGPIVFALASTPSRAAVVQADEYVVSTFTASSQHIAISTSLAFVNTTVNMATPLSVLTSQSSFTASAFFGYGGELLSVNNHLIDSTNSFSGANTFGSSTTVASGGREISFSTGATAAIKISSSGIVTFYPELHNSSRTIIPTPVSVSTTIGPCVPGSTITVQSSGAPLELVFLGNMGPLISNDVISINFLVDGSFLPGFSSGKTICSYSPINSFSPWGHSVFCQSVASGLTASAHSLCVTVSGNSPSTHQIRGSAASYFYVLELK